MYIYKDHTHIYRNKDQRTHSPKTTDTPRDMSYKSSYKNTQMYENPHINTRINENTYPGPRTLPAMCRTCHCLAAMCVCVCV